MNIFKYDKEVSKKFKVIGTLYILAGIAQGFAVVSLLPLFKSIFENNYGASINYLIFIGILTLIYFALTYIGLSIGNHMAVWEVCDNQINRIGKALIKLPLGWFDSSSKGRVSKGMHTDTNTLSHYPSIVAPVVLGNISSVTVIGIALCLLSWKIAMVIVLMSVLLVYYWKKNVKALGENESSRAKINENMESTIVEFSQLQAVLRASGKLVRGWEKLNQALLYDQKAGEEVLSVKGAIISKYVGAANLGLLLVLIISAVDLVNGQIELYTFMATTIAMIRFTRPIADTQPYSAEIQNCKAALSRIDSIVHAEKLEEAKSPKKLEKKEEMAIDFQKVDFSYVEGIKVLKNIDLKIPPCSMTALVGASGSGKSTINRLIARFWDVDSGSVSINGINIKELKEEELMQSISMVFQEVYLFNTTIKENVLMAKKDATEQELLEACKKARLDEIIDRLPQGVDTVVGEGGSSLSGGEKQRVSIARAFLKDCPILLLDEITSALDGSNERKITEALKELAENRTVVVIAHRLSQVKNADQIVLMDQGGVQGIGTHQELLEGNTIYRNLWEASLETNVWKI